MKSVVKKLLIALIFFTMLPAEAFEDCIIIGDARFTDIRIENNQIIDVYPLITLMNEKNTLIVHPLEEGETRFCVLKNDKNIVMFNVKVTKTKTIIDEVDGCEIFGLDMPNELFELDLPPESVEQADKQVNNG